MFLRASDLTKLMPSHGGQLKMLHALLGGRMIVPGRAGRYRPGCRPKLLIR